jgi:hypothetical protein
MNYLEEYQNLSFHPTMEHLVKILHVLPAGGVLLLC